MTLCGLYNYSVCISTLKNELPVLTQKIKIIEFK